MSPSTAPAASPFRCILDIRASLGECPVWSVAEQVLYWVDINAPSLNRFDPATGRNTAMAMPESIGCFALRRAGGFVVALRSGFWLARKDGTLDRKVAAAPYDPAHHRFNDGRCDPQGRLLAGSMNESRDAATGALYRLDPDFALTPLLSGMMISNGLAFSPDGRTMYHTDTDTQTVNGYEYDAASGTPSRPRVLVRFTAEGDRPDGAAVDRDGCYWTALYRGGKVKRIAPDGRVLAEYRGARDVPDHVRVRRPRPEDALRHQCAADAGGRRAGAAAVFRRPLRHGGGRAGTGRAPVRRLNFTRTCTRRCP